MSVSLRSAAARLLLAVLCSAGLAGLMPEIAAAQDRSHAAIFTSRELRDSPAIARGAFVVVIDLDTNLLHFVQGRNILWSAPVGTGMDLRLETSDRKWEFSTPTGVYQVQYKEENPVWLAPDWYFIENKLPVPAANDPKRRMPGVLGEAAVYIGSGLAIHGTNKPDLLGQRVSHGCIRLANEYALRLYHNVQLGTKVIIIGTEQKGERGKLIPGQVPGAGPVDARTQRLRDRALSERARVLRELNALSSEKLASALTEELRTRTQAAEPRWPTIASVLVRRALKEDVEAAEGLLAAVEEVRNRRVRAEYATFLADVYYRGSPTVARVLARMDEPARTAAAQALVEGSLALYPGSPDEFGAPWPTLRLPRTVLKKDAQTGWDALHAAEQDYRTRTGIGTARAGR